MLVDAQAKAVVQDACQQKGIPFFDVTGPLVQFMAEHVGVSPANELSRLHEVNEKYFHRIAAIEFATEHDDGLGLATLNKADIVLVGVSRVSKSPTAIWLATHGYKTANVSITVETGFPPELDRVKRKTVALTMQPKRLQEIRVARMSQPKLADIGYHHLPTVIKEVMDAEREYRERAYPIVDVTTLTIEQTAATVLQKLGLTRDGL